MRHTISKRKFELVLVLITFLLAGFLRLYRLGYSNFYGDETKTFYLRKDVAAKDFLLNQRKGPVQFLVVWATEKLFGFHEFWTRLPFALAGGFSLVVFYFLVRKLFGSSVALLSTLFMSLNGFFIAFSRTAQYQSFLMLFGLLSIVSVVYYYENLKKCCLLFSSLFLALAFLTHYDAVFFAIPVAVFLVKLILEKKLTFPNTLLFFLVPFCVVIGFFYVPYITSGKFFEHTFNYITRRVSGKEYQLNKTLYTFRVYNPYDFFVPFVFVIFSFFGEYKWQKSAVVLWFFITYFVFETVFLNPGTHIMNFLIPLFVLASLGINEFMVSLDSFFGRRKFLVVQFLLQIALSVALFYSAFFNASVFTPKYGISYPWADTEVAGVTLPAANKDYHLYLYGFPYNVGWDQIRDHFKEKGSMPHSFYTNDNVTIGEYYLLGVPAHKPHTAQMPEYYIDVVHGQEFTPAELQIYEKYTIEKDFYVEGRKTATLYKIKSSI
jgi:4-amino-4-deoxy-L-arabinose transferase-like glycosyltransferase